MRKLIHTVLFVSLLQAAYGQDAKQSLLDVKKSYEQSERLHVVMRIRAFENASAANPFFQEKAEVSKDKENFAYQLGEMETLLNDRYMVMVNRHAKEIVYTTREKAPEVSDMVQASMDSAFKFYKDIVFVGTENGEDHYRLSKQMDDVKRIDIFIGGKVMKRMEYDYANGQHVSIVFEIFNIQPFFGANTFSESRYFVTGADKKMRPATAYAGFIVQSAESETFENSSIQE